MRDLKSKGLIVAKGVMFLLITMTAGLLLWIERPSIKTALLLALLVWAACRFYYFLFYVLEKYVDSRLQYAGLIGLAAAFRRRRRDQRNAT
jgi:hypothetical protein